MRHLAPKLTLALFTTLVFVACGGGGGGGGGNNPPPNNPPTANAGPIQTVSGGATVTLNGTASADGDGTIASYAWSQTAGTTVTLSGAATAQPTFVAPQVLATTILTFSLIVTDNRFAASTAATVDITVNPSPNVLPNADAGDTQTTTSGFTVTLNGSASADSDGSIAGYVWLQTAGGAVNLTGATTALPTFVAPTVGAATTFTFSLVVTDNRGGVSAADTVNVVVNPTVAGTTNISGTITFARIPIRPNSPGSGGLNYGAQVQQPARSVVVRAYNPNSQQVIAGAITSATGTYTLNVANSQQIRIEVTSEMARNGALPNWRFRVQNGWNGDLYVYTDNVIFDSTTGGTRNLAIPSGFSSSGTPNGTRASAPFAILDTIYQGVQTIVGVAPTANFPLLVLDWAPDNSGGDTFFTSDPVQHIVLSAELSEDTDEFDQHVIAHEFGHYIEFNFSRADNIGGAHSLGDKLDMRTAFGEGFGYAFAAIVLNDPLVRDTGFNTNGTGRTSEFNVETNPSTTSPGTPSSNYGCWCSESSVWSILWDIYDPAQDSNDTLSLGFAPIWAVLTGAQKNTPALTSIFSFITALKANNPASVTAINTLVNAQNIDTANINAFGSTETHVPDTVQSNGALPVHAIATINGGPVIVRSVNDAGFYNALGNHRFVRFNVPTSSLVTITVTTSNTALDADPDFLIYRIGGPFSFAESPVVGTETKTLSLAAGNDYLLDVYDCGNVCTDADGEPLGTPGDYNLTVTITQ